MPPKRARFQALPILSTALQPVDDEWILQPTLGDVLSLPPTESQAIPPPSAPPQLEPEKEERDAKRKRHEAYLNLPPKVRDPDDPFRLQPFAKQRPFVVSIETVGADPLSRLPSSSKQEDIDKMAEHSKGLVAVELHTEDEVCVYEFMFKLFNVLLGHQDVRIVTCKVFHHFFDVVGMANQMAIENPTHDPHFRIQNTWSSWNRVVFQFMKYASFALQRALVGITQKWCQHQGWHFRDFLYNPFGATKLCELVWAIRRDTMVNLETRRQNRHTIIEATIVAYRGIVAWFKSQPDLRRPRDMAPTYWPRMIMLDESDAKEFADLNSLRAKQSQEAMHHKLMLTDALSHPLSQTHLQMGTTVEDCSADVCNAHRLLTNSRTTMTAEEFTMRLYAPGDDACVFRILFADLCYYGYAQARRLGTVASGDLIIIARRINSEYKSLLEILAKRLK